MQMLCMRNRATTEGYNHSREPKNSGIDQQLTTDSAKIVATMCVQAYGNHPLISTPHPIPDAPQLLNLPLPTHELWVQATQIHHLLSHTSNYSRTEEQKSNSWEHELNQHYPTPSNATESSKQHKTGSEHLPQQARTEPDAYASRLHKGDVFAHVTSFKQTSETLSKRSVSARGVQRYHSHFNRSCLPSAIE
ncbi:hypothetical protein F511_26306 [Dorcoceras hygrometricum]|uniref:Uncharacterized protein n=1 Tax=Dorcoceras hygrometricum TaxID=472368 RepID=A0A2Z7AE33_9LAMI|nr:hypothetical protein F511_26306 [Dorcoceras hygrometricum]